MSSPVIDFLLSTRHAVACWVSANAYARWMSCRAPSLRALYCVQYDRSMNGQDHETRSRI